MKRTTIFLPDPYADKIDAFCAESGLTYAEVIRRAVDLYLEQEVPKLIGTAKALTSKRRAK